jgi:hypothetical protein
MRGKFRANLDFRDYPLDKQLLTIVIEDSNLDANSLVYVADKDNMAFAKKFYLSGWESAGQPTYQTDLQIYETNYGNPERELDPRFGVGVAGIFGAVSSMIVVSSNMPENPYFSLSDKVHLLSLGFIFLSILISCVVLKIHKHGYLVASRRIDLCAGITMVAAYATTITLLSI